MLINEEFFDDVKSSDITDCTEIPDYAPDHAYEHVTETYILTEGHLYTGPVSEICTELLYPLQKRINAIFGYFQYITGFSAPVFVLYGYREQAGTVHTFDVNGHTVHYTYTRDSYYGNGDNAFGFYIEFDGMFNNAKDCLRFLQLLTNLSSPVFKGQSTNHTMYGRYGTQSTTLTRETYDQTTANWSQPGYQYQIKYIQEFYDWCKHLMGPENCRFIEIRNIFNSGHYEYDKIISEENINMNDVKYIDIKQTISTVDASFIDQFDNSDSNDVTIELLQCVYYRADYFYDTDDRQRAKSLMGSGSYPVKIQPSIGNIGSHTYAVLLYIMETPFRHDDVEGLLVLRDSIDVQEAVDLLMNSDETEVEGLEKIAMFLRPLHYVKVDVAPLIKTLVSKACRVTLSQQYLRKIMQKLSEEK